MLDPWKLIDQLPGWRVDWAWAPAHRGVTYFRRRTIVLDIGMTARDERCVIAHEAVHALRGPFPRWMRPREEETVSRAAARHLIDIVHLGDALAWSCHPVEAADELNVDVPTLMARIRGLHPAEHHYLTRRTEHHAHHA